MNKINNINIESVKSFETQIKNDPSVARKTQGVMLGIKLKKLTTKVEADINFSKIFFILSEDNQ
jgi:hypothetical protein